tara:strand:- start:1160 stop:1315 length:156 start_codon:yes stop_codon:yes gene_type:complete
LSSRTLEIELLLNGSELADANSGIARSSLDPKKIRMVANVPVKSAFFAAPI